MECTRTECRGRCPHRPAPGGYPPVKWGNVVFTPFHSTHQSVPWASGRWRASTPTLKPWARSIQRTGWLREVSGGWVAAPTGRIMFTARVNGRQSSGNVGDDAHIVPLRGDTPGQMGECYSTLSHSTHRSDFRASGRWRASTPTLKPLARAIQRTGWLREVSGGWVAAPTGRIMFTARVNGRQSSVNVGDDAHIVPLRGDTPRSNGGMAYLPCSIQRTNRFRGLRVDGGHRPLH